MPDIQNLADRDFSVYDSMSDEDLEKLLWNDFSKQKGEETDTEQLLYITEVLAQRRKDRNEGKSPAQAWESFKQNYYTDKDNLCISDNAPVCTHRRSGHWKWGLIATAAVLAMVVGTSVTAKAFKFDIWGPVAKWTKETFYFSSDGQSVPTTMPQHGDGTELLPTWIPEGYELTDTTITSTPSQNLLVVEYMNNDKLLRIKIAGYSQDTSTIYQKGEDPVEIYRSNGIDYYLFINSGRRTAVWITQNRECSITGPLSEAEIKKMIDSIGKD